VLVDLLAVVALIWCCSYCGNAVVDRCLHDAALSALLCTTYTLAFFSALLRLQLVLIAKATPQLQVGIRYRSPHCASCAVAVTVTHSLTHSLTPSLLPSLPPSLSLCGAGAG
jgi:hypothetical protein